MNLDFNNVNIPITKEDILARVSQYDIFKRYCKNFEEIEVSFCSELRTDYSPDCRIFITHDNNLMYRDFASGENYNCWSYVSTKFGCSYFEALNIIANDFGLRGGKIDIDPKIIVANDEIKDNIIIPRVKSNINILSQAYNIVDYNYWSQYHISLELLQEYNVFSCKYAYLFKGDRRYITEYKNNNPCYAYRFTRNGCYTYKIYKPLDPDKKKKWLFSGGAAEDVEGYDQLDLSGDLVIITKSMKDVIVLRVLGYNAISLQGEANKLEYDFYMRLTKRFDRIISLYDNDLAGIKGANRLLEQYKITPIYIPIESGCKDISDYIKEYGLDKSKELMNNVINE